MRNDQSNPQSVQRKTPDVRHRFLLLVADISMVSLKLSSKFPFETIVLPDSNYRG